MRPLTLVPSSHVTDEPRPCSCNKIVRDEGRYGPTNARGRRWEESPWLARTNQTWKAWVLVFLTECLGWSLYRLIGNSDISDIPFFLFSFPSYFLWLALAFGCRAVGRSIFD